MSKRIVLGSLGFVATVFSLAWLFWPSDEERILTLFEELSEVASKTEDASALADAMVVKDFKELFAPEVTISIRSKARIAGDRSNQELAQLYGRLRIASRRMGLRHEQLEILSIEDMQDQPIPVSMSGTCSWPHPPSFVFRRGRRVHLPTQPIK